MLDKVVYSILYDLIHQGINAPTYREIRLITGYGRTSIMKSIDALSSAGLISSSIDKSSNKSYQILVTPRRLAIEQGTEDTTGPDEAPYCGEDHSPVDTSGEDILDNLCGTLPPLDVYEEDFYR